MIERFFKGVGSRRVIGLFCALLTGVIIFSLSFLSSSKVLAAKAKKAEEPKKAAEAKKAEDPKKKKLLSELTEPEKSKLMDDAKEAINTTAWDITLRMSDNEKAPEESDKLTFLNDTVASDKMKAQGFGASNYTIRLKGQTGEIVIWETMQTSEKNGIAFWRGEIRGDSMRGVLSWHVNETKKVDYAFNSKTKGVAVPEPVVEAPPAAVLEEKPVTTTPEAVETEIIEGREAAPAAVEVPAAPVVKEEPVAPIVKEEPKVKAPEPAQAPKQEKKKGRWGR